MAIVGDLTTWKNRIQGATDGELSTLYRQIGAGDQLYPLVADEVARRSGLPPAAFGTGLSSMGPLGTVRDVADDPRASGPLKFATSAFAAAQNNDTDTALKLYDAGLDRYGSAFAATFDSVKNAGQDRAGSAKTGQPIPTTVVQPSDGLGSVAGGGPGPWSRFGNWVADNVKVGGPPVPPDKTDTGYRMRGEALEYAVDPENTRGGWLGMGGFPRSPDVQGPPAATPGPVQGPPSAPPSLPRNADEAVAQMLGETRQAESQYRADRAAEEGARRTKALDVATGDARALIDENGYSPEAAFAEAMKQPAAAGSIDPNELRSRLGLPPVAAASTSAGLGSLNNLPGPSRTGAGTAEGRIFYDSPDVARTARARIEAGDEPDPAPGDAGTDPPVGRRVVAVGPIEPRGRGLPRLDRSVVAPRGTDGLATFAAPAPAVTNAKPGTQADGPPVRLTPEPAVKNAEAAPAGDDRSAWWEALMTAGLGTLASDSPTALGAIGTGGLAGVKRLGEIRKEQREERADQALAKYRDQSIDVQNRAIESQDRRAGEAIASNERLQAQRLGAEQGFLNQRLAHDASLQGMRINSEYDLAEFRGSLEAMLQERRIELERQGKQDDFLGRYQFLKKQGGLSDNTAALAAVGFGPTKGDKPSPMGDKETMLSLDLAAQSLLGEGYTGQDLLTKLPPPALEQVLAGLGKQESPAAGSKAIVEAIRGAGLYPKNTGWIFNNMQLVPGQAPGQPAPGAGSYKYVPGQGLVRQ